MPQKVNIEGKEVELFTQDEMDAKAKEAGETATKTATEAATKVSGEALETYKKEHPDQAAELKTATDALAEAENKLKEAEDADGSGDGGDDSEQIKRLRKEREDAEAKSTETVEKIQKDMESMKETMIGNVKAELLEKASKGDAELQKKIEFEYDGFIGEANTKEEITLRVEKAVTIVTGAKPNPGFLDNNTGASDRGDGNSGGEEEKNTPNENQKAIGKVLGISEEDRKKYGPGGEKEPKSSSTTE